MSVIINGEDNVMLQVLEEQVSVNVINDDYIVLTISNTPSAHLHEISDVNGLAQSLFLKQDAIFVSATAPQYPVTGQLWLDIS